ncbi:glycosyltransferase family 4 protein [Streptomyces sp. NBC_01594]|uniref:glycosyltransferase family 4 protein n=1 Tax=Streptomyces sp. NBC_01594 TaxID=2975890 RepID=UPI0038678B3D
MLLVGHSSGLLGAERSLLEIASSAVNDEHEVVVSLPGPGPLWGLLEAAGVRVVNARVRSWLGPWHRIPPVGLLRLWQIRRSVPAYLDLIRRIDPDVVVSNSAVVVAPSLASQRMGVPHLWVVRESLRDNRELRSLLPKSLIARRIFDRSAVVCTVSPYVAEQLNSLAGSFRRTHTVSPNPAAEAAGLPPTVREYPGGRRPRLLLPGFFSREKGQHTAILACFLARRAGKEVNLRIVGRGKLLYRSFLRVLITILGLRSNVSLLPWADSLSSEIQGADFVLMTSRNEAFGRSVVESFSHGVPVIGLARGATTTLLREGGGLLVQPATPQQLATILSRVSDMSEGKYLDLCEKAAARGDGFRHGPSQYQMFSLAVGSIGGGSEVGR